MKESPFVLPILWVGSIPCSFNEKYYKEPQLWLASTTMLDIVVRYTQLSKVSLSVFDKRDLFFGDSIVTSAYHIKNLDVRCLKMLLTKILI